MSSFNTSAYDIEKTSGVCAVTGKQLEPGQTIIALLVEEGQTLKRIDLCEDAWDESQPPDNMLASWKTTVPQPNEKKRVFVDDEVLMNLLRRLEEADQPDRIAFRFVLMLILMRKKLLRYNRTEQRSVVEPAEGEPTERDWWLLTPKLDLTKGPMGKWKDDETIAVMDPHLDDEQIRQVSDQIGEILNAEL